FGERNGGGGELGGGGCESMYSMVEMLMSIDAFSRVGGGGETLGGGDSIEDEEVSLVDGVLEGALGALGLDREALVDAVEALWWLIIDEEDDELGICIWREFIRRDLFENGMSLNWFRNFQNMF
ncbi:hypothetical protein Tco_1071141, partial [Tanacetum coccineum]